MSRIDELIQQYCPDGVTYMSLNEVLTIKNGRDYKHLGSGNVPVYGSGGIIAYIDTAIYDKPSVLIPRKGSLNKLYYVDEPFWNVDTIFYTDINYEIVIPKYVYYCIGHQHIERLNKAGGVPSLTQGILNKLIIPVPPLPVQEEIVRILDKFTELEAELESELEAELETRRKQYEYYRDQLLTFGDEVEWKPLGDCIKDHVGGGTPSKCQKHYWNGNIPWASVKDIVKCNLILSQTEDFITKEGLNHSTSNVIPCNEIIVATRITPGKMVISGSDIAINQDLRGLFFKDFLNKKFVVYFSKTLQIEGSGTTVKGITIDQLKKISIPLLPLVEQERIVAILDKFDALVNDISSGLPAELEMRRKQYEYYRDRLLTFKPFAREA